MPDSHIHGGTTAPAASTESTIASLLHQLLSLQQSGRTPQAIRPFQFPTLRHLDERIDRVIERAATVEALQASTLRSYRDAYGSLRRFLTETKNERRFLGGALDVQKETLLAWQGWLLSRKSSRVTVRTYWRTLASVLRRIEEQDQMVNPLRWLPSPRTGRLQPRALRPVDARTLVLFLRNFQWSSPFIRTRNLAIVGCMLLAGLRRSEVLKLRCEDIDTGRGTIAIQRGKGRYGGKDRTAYMSPQLSVILTDYETARARLGRASPSFFTALRRDRAIGPGCLRRLFLFIQGKTGIHVTPHVLRHTYATLLRQAGVSDRVSMALLGHEHLSTLQRYSHVFDEEYVTEVRKLTLPLD